MDECEAEHRLIVAEISRFAGFIELASPSPSNPAPAEPGGSENAIMEATLEREAPAAEKAAISLIHLQHALATVAPAIPTGNATIPVLKSVRIEQLSEGLAFESTDLTLAIRALSPLSCGLQKPIVIPAERLINLAKLLQGQEVRITATAARATLKCGRNTASFPLMSASLWPDNRNLFRAEGVGVTFRQQDLARALKFASICIGAEERYTLNGVLMQGDGKNVRFVSTDGNRMMIYTINSAEKVDATLIPQRLVKALTPMLSGDDGVNIAADEKLIVASIPAETPVFVSTKRIVGKFPQWEAAVPKNPQAEVTVNAKEFLLCLERAVLLGNDETKAVALTFGEGAIKIESNDPQAGEAQEFVDANGTPENPFRTGVCATFLIQLLKKLDGEVKIAIPKEPGSAMLFKATPAENETLAYIVMPMRLEK